MSAALVGLFCLAVPLFPLAAPVDGKNILMVLWRCPTEAESAFKLRLRELAPAVSYTEIDHCEQNREKLATTLRGLQGDMDRGRFDLIYTYGTVVSQMVKGLSRQQVPMVFNIVFDPAASHLVDSLEHPGGNITGVTNGVPVDEQFRRLQRLRPFSSLLVLFTAGEPNSNLIERQVRAWAAGDGIPVESRRVAPGNRSLEMVLEELRSGRLRADALYAGADSYLASQAAAIRQAAGDRMVLFGGTETFVQQGWLAAYAPHIADLGRGAADLAARILAGENPANLPVVRPPPALLISPAALARQGLTAPPEAVMVGKSEGKVSAPQQAIKNLGAAFQ